MLKSFIVGTCRGREQNIKASRNNVANNSECRINNDYTLENRHVWNTFCAQEPDFEAKIIAKTCASVYSLSVFLNIFAFFGLFC